MNLISKAILIVSIITISIGELYVQVVSYSPEVSSAII